MGNTLSCDSIQKLSLHQKEESDSYDVTDGSASSDSNQLFVSGQNGEVTTNAHKNEKNGKLDKVLMVTPEIDNVNKINNSKKGSEAPPANTYDNKNNGTNENEIYGKLDVLKPEMENSIEMNESKKQSEVPPADTNENENNGNIDGLVMPDMDNSIEINKSKKYSEQNNGVIFEIDSCTFSDSEDELSMYLSAENMNKIDKNEKKLDNDIGIGNVNTIKVQKSTGHTNDEKNNIDHVKHKSAMENSVQNVKSMEVQMSLDHINKVNNNLESDKANDTVVNDTGSLNENIAGETLNGNVENNATNSKEKSQSGTNCDENNGNDPPAFIEEQNNNDIGLQSDIISVDDNTDMTDDELSMYLTPSESKEVSPFNEKRKTIFTLHDLKKEPQRTGLTASCNFQNNQEPKYTNKDTDFNKNITDELESIKDIQLMQTDKSADLKYVPSLNTNQTEKQEVIETQKVYPKTYFMPETAKVSDSSVHLRTSSMITDKPSPIKQKDVRTLEKMLHYSAEGFSDQIIIQSPSKIISEPHSSDTGLTRGNSLVEITIIDADETKSHEETKVSVFAASSSAQLVSPAVKGVHGSCIEDSKIVSKEIIVLGQNSVPSMFDENDNEQESEFSIITHEFLDNIKKQGNQKQEGMKHSYVVDKGKGTKPKSVKNKAVTSSVKTTNKSKRFDSFKYPKQKAKNEQEPKSERPQVASGKFFRKDNKLFIVTNVDGKMVEKEFVRSQKEDDIKLIKKFKTETECEVKAQTYVGEEVQNNSGNNKSSLKGISKNTMKIDAFSDKMRGKRLPTKAAKAHIEGKFLEKSKFADVKLQSIMKKDIGMVSGIRTSPMVNAHNGPPVGSNNQRALTSSVIDLTRDSRGVKLKNEIGNYEKASSGSILQSSQSEMAVVSRNLSSSYIDNNKPVRETNGQDISSLSENLLKDEKEKSEIMSPQISETQNDVHLSQEVTDNTKHSNDVHQEIVIHSEGEENADIKPEKDLDEKDRSKDLKDKATIRVFKVEQSPKKSGNGGKRMAKIIILQDDGRYHEVDNVEIDEGTVVGTSSLTSVPVEKDSKSALLRSGARSREGRIRNGSSAESQIDSKVKDSESSFVDAGVQSDICCCTCNCKCKAGVPSSAAKEKKAVKTNITEERLEDTEALAKVKRQLRMNEEVSINVDRASADIHLNPAIKNEDLMDLSLEANCEDLVLKLRKQVELMRLIGKNKKKAGCILSHQPLRRRKQPAEFSKEGETLNQQANILPKMTIISPARKIGSTSEPKSTCSEIENKKENKDSENSDVPKKGVKRKSREILSPREQHIESLTDNKEKYCIKLKTELTTDVLKRSRLKAQVSSGSRRELKKLKIDMKQDIIDYPEKLNDTLTNNNSVQTRHTRQKVKSQEISPVKKEISRTPSEKVSDTSPVQSEVKGNKNRRGPCKQMKNKAENVDPALENTTILDKTVSNKSSEKKEESKKHKTTCKRELDNLFIDMVVGNKTTKSPSANDQSDTQTTTTLKRKPQNECHEEARENKQKSISPESKRSKSEKRSLGESFSPIKKGKLILSDDFIPDISNAMEECLRLIKEKEKVIEEENVGGDSAEMKQETFEDHDMNFSETKTEMQVKSETGKTSKNKVKESVPGGFEIGRQLCENCGKFVTVYYTKTGLLCYVSEKQLVNIDDNEQQLCEACGSIDDSGSVKAHYVLQEKNQTIDESKKRKDIYERNQATSKIDCVSGLKRSPKGRSRKIKPNKETSSKQLKVRFTEPKRSPKKDRSPKRRKIQDRSENNTEVKKKRKRLVKESRAMTKIKDKKPVNEKTDSNLEHSASVNPPMVKKSESSHLISVEHETDKTIESVDINKMESKITDSKATELESQINSEDKIPDMGNKLRKVKGMKKIAARQLKRSEALKHSRKSRLKHSPWHWQNRYPRKFEKFQRYEWKKLLKEDVTFDFHDIVKEEEKPNVKHLEKLMHEVLGKTKDPERKKKKKHRTEKKKDKDTINMPDTLTSPLERPRNFQGFQFSPTGHISSSETETDIEGPFLSKPLSNIADRVTDIQYVSEHQADTDSSGMKEFVAVKLDDISQHDDEILLVDDVPVTIL